EAAADFREPREVAAVAAEEHAAFAVVDRPRAPERAIAVAQTAAGKVLCRRRVEMHAVDVGALPPVELPHLLARDAPPDQTITDAQRGQEHRGFRCERLDRGAVEMS